MFLRLAFFVLAFLAGSSAFAQTKPFDDPDASRQARRYEAQLKASADKSVDIAQERATAERLMREGKEPRGAVTAFERVVALEPDDTKSWLGLAQSLLAVPVNRSGSERFELPANATGAAFNAYRTSDNDGARARALKVLSDAFTRRSLWRPAINALTSSLALRDEPSVRAAYDKMRAEHGFRMVDYKVERDSASPRVCLQFSEPLASGPVDFSKFIAVEGKDLPMVSAEDRQLCIDGLAHGKRYGITVRAGLPSALASETLLKSAELAIYVRDRSPSVRLSGNTYVLPNRGQAGIPVVSVNTQRVGIELFRIGDRNLVSAVLSGELKRQISGYQANQIASQQGTRIWRGDMPVSSKLNEEVTTAFPVSDAVSKLEPGVYAMLVRPLAENDSVERRDDDEDHDAGNGKSTSQWFIVSDLGLTAMTSPDGLHVFVRSLAAAEAQAGVEVRLVARNNEILGRATTDAKGYARFDAGLAKGEGGQTPAIVVAEKAGADYAFLDLTTAAFDLTDRGVAGREPPGALEAYLFTERGVYRQGESVHLTAVVRDAALKAPAPIPLTLVMTRPDGVEHKRLQVADQGFGGRTVSSVLSKTAMTGTWRVRVYSDPKAAPIGETAFLVEDFVPERLELTLDAVTKSLVVDQPGKIAVKGRYLYGPPAANLALEGEVLVRVRSGDVEGFPGYVFGLADEGVAMQRQQLEDLPRTGETGAAEIAVSLPPLPRTARPLEARIMTRLVEPGGRAIERSITLPIDTRQPRIGIKPLFDQKTINDGADAGFDVVLLGADGKPVDGAALRWQLQRIDTRWQWYNRDGAWNYEAVKIGRRVGDGEIKTADGKPARISARLAWGRYKLEVTAPDGSTVSSVAFNAGWYAADSADTPELLDVALDKASYKAGDTATLTIDARGSGKALVAVLGRGLASMQEVAVSGKGSTATIKVESDWAPGAYVTAIMYRPMDEKAKRMPGRSIGVKWLEIDKAGHTIGVAMQAPEKVGSASTLKVPLKLTGLAPGEGARVVVSAVDLGILNLTRFETPSPEKHFFAQRRMASEIRDLYGRLIDGMRADRGRIRSGGDGGMAMEGAPQVENPLALFSGLVTPAADGTATVSFDLPEFNGTVRLTAVAWSASKVGSAKSDVIVRDPVALLVTAPRFMTLGDEARLLVDVHNVEGAAGSYKVLVTRGADAAAKEVASRELALAAGQRRAEAVTLKADALGAVQHTVRVTGPGGINVARTLEFDVKPPAAGVRRVTVSSLKSNGGSISLGPDLLADMVPGRSSVSVSVGPLAGLDVAGLMLSLDQYPYGCAEQTTSKAMPLVYLNEMAKMAGMTQRLDVKERVEKAIARLVEMQDGSGAFGIWGAGGGDMWLTSYVTDFLTRAKEAGYDVPKRPFSQALDRLRNTVASYAEFQKGGEDLAYALYVLARNGRGPVGELRYYADTRLDRFGSALARAQIGAALAMLGDKERSERAFTAALASLDGNDEGYRADYGSTLRDRAAALTLVAETGVVRSAAPKLVQLVARAMASREHTSTQENAWLILAARSLIEDAKRLPLSVNGTKREGVLSRSFTREDLARQPVVIRNDGADETGVIVTVNGDSATPEPAASKGFAIERHYYTLDGKEVTMPSATGGTGTVAQNQRLVVVVKVTPEAASQGRLLVVDRLPAGLEIENPRLLDSASAKQIPWLEGAAPVEHAEFRDDRFVAAVNYTGAQAKQPIAMAYMVRAVIPGSFTHPGASVEDMYRPERFARTASGRLAVTAKE